MGSRLPEGISALISPQMTTGQFWQAQDGSMARESAKDGSAPVHNMRNQPGHSLASTSVLSRPVQKFPRYDKALAVATSTYRHPGQVTSWDPSVELTDAVDHTNVCDARDLHAPHRSNRSQPNVSCGVSIPESHADTVGADSDDADTTVIMSIHSLGKAALSEGRYEEALSYMHDALSMIRMVQGEAATERAPELPHQARAVPPVKEAGPARPAVRAAATTTT